MDVLSTPKVLAAIAEGLGDWRRLGLPLAARYRSADAAARAAFAAAVMATGAAAGHEVAEVRAGRGFVDVALFSVDEATGAVGVTAADLGLARAVTGLAREHGMAAAPGEVTQLELALDTADEAAVAPFWSALLTGDPGNVVRGSVLDPTGRVPSVWFQSTTAGDTPRQRWHIDLWLAPEVAEERIAAALAAGGTVVDASEAPSFTVLADPEGNKACVCTALTRE
ncbi:VOC family protein [Actinacidiphila yeochonensis]|uniref:VOC family protein n=1 Tax=Actinacidiphila yeochonensis TaxID=89050 RepID=UPI000568E2B7|nr:VOC family protein [Actinacidiphila yeochonensis]